MSIGSFINYNYEIVFHGENVNISNLSSVREFLLIDNHKSQGHSVINSLFINKFGKNGDIVGIEAVPCLKVLKANESSQSVWLKEGLHLIGWDQNTIREMMQSEQAQKIADLELLGQIYLKKYIENKEDLENRDALVSAFEASNEEQSKFDQRTLTNQLIQTFPLRTKSMENMLTTCGNETYAENDPKTLFLMAGAQHLNKELDNSNFSIAEFYEFLKSRNVVILSPKSRPVAEQGLERDEAIKDINEIIKTNNMIKLIAKMFSKAS